MSRMILIPVVGTIAALIAIFAFHPEREQSRTPAPVPRVPQVEPTAPTPGPRLPEPPPQSREWFFNVEANGTLTETDSGESFATAKDVLDQIAPAGTPRPKVLLGPGEGVTDEQLEQAAAALSEGCDVRIFRRG